MATLGTVDSNNNNQEKVNDVVDASTAIAGEETLSFEKKKEVFQSKSISPNICRAESESRVPPQPHFQRCNSVPGSFSSSQNNQQMSPRQAHFSSSSFYDPREHPTIEAQVSDFSKFYSKVLLLLGSKISTSVQCTLVCWRRSSSFCLASVIVADSHVFQCRLGKSFGCWPDHRLTVSAAIDSQIMSNNCADAFHRATGRFGVSCCARQHCRLQHTEKGAPVHALNWCHIEDSETTQFHSFGDCQEQ